MKKYGLLLLLILLFAACSTSKENQNQLGDRKAGSFVPFGDPFILLYKNAYYAYGTHSADGIEVYKSNNLKKWKYLGLALNKKDVWGGRWFWAPEVYHTNGKFYMYYSADEHTCVAISDFPTGPFTQEKKQPVVTSEKTIDSSLFTDDDGKAYLFFVRFNDGNNIWVAEMNDDMQTVKPETMHPCVHVSQSWEKVWPRVNEGPFVVKHNNKYYMTYSANSYESPFYGVGCATADAIMGQWTKYGSNPVLQKPGSLVGVGHNALFLDKKNRLMMVFHAHHDSHSIHPRRMCITTVSFKDDTLRVSPKYFLPKIVK